MLDNHIYFTTNHMLNGMNKPKEVVSIVQQINIAIVKFNKEIYVTIVIETRSKNGSEDPQLCHLVLFAQGYDLLHIQLYEFHSTVKIKLLCLTPKI